MTGWPPLPNATLVMVQAAGTSDDYDRASAVGATKWQGAASVVWLEYQDRVEGAEANVLIHRELVAAQALGVNWQQADVVSVLRGGGTVTGTVRQIKTTQASSNGDVPGTVRLVLNDA